MYKLQLMDHGQHGVNGLNVLCLVIAAFKLETEHAPIRYLSTMVLRVWEVALTTDRALPSVQV